MTSGEQSRALRSNAQHPGWKTPAFGRSAMSPDDPLQALLADNDRTFKDDRPRFSCGTNSSARASTNPGSSGRAHSPSSKLMTSSNGEIWYLVATATVAIDRSPRKGHGAAYSTRQRRSMRARDRLAAAARYRCRCHDQVQSWRGIRTIE